MGANPFKSLYRQWAATAGNRTALARLLESLIDTLAAGSAFLGATLWVSPDGDDETGARGTQNAYKTVQAAVNASQNGDLVMLGPGTYAENVVVPPTRTSLVIRGFNRLNTSIVPASGAGITYKPSGAGSLTIEDLTVTSATTALDLTPPNSAAFVSQMAVRRCNLTGTTAALAVQNVSGVVVEDCTIGILSITDSEQARLIDVLCTAATLGVQSTAIVGLDHVGYFVESGRISTLTHTGRAIVECNAAAFVDTYTATALTSTATGGGTIRFYGVCETFNLNFPAAQAASPNNPSCKLRGARINAGTFASAGTSGDATTTIDARNATINTAVLASTGTQNVVLDVRGGELDVLTSFTARCYIDRDVVNLGQLAVANGGTTFTFGSGPLAAVPPFGPATASYDVKITELAPIAAVADLCSLGARTFSTFALTQGSGGSRNVLVTLLRSNSP